MKKVKWLILVAILVLLGVILYVCFAKKDTPEAEESTVVESGETGVAEQPEEVVVDETLVKEAFDINVKRTMYMGTYDVEGAFIDAMETYYIPKNGPFLVPIFKLNTLEELEQFKQDFYELMDVSDVAKYTPLGEMTDGYDEAFFEENTLMLVYFATSSGSYDFDVESVHTDGNTFCIYVKCTNPEGAITCDVAGWLVSVAVPDSVVAECTEFDAVLSHKDVNPLEQIAKFKADKTLVKEAFDIGIHYTYSPGIDYIMYCHKHDIYDEEEFIDNELLGEVESYLYPLNLEKMSEKAIEHLPVYKMDTLEELVQFKQVLYKVDDIFGAEGSLEEITESCDEEFFEENTLILAYLYASSGSYYYTVESVRMQDNTLSVHVKCTNPAEGETCDVADYFVTVSVPDSVIADCTEFDADVKY